MKKGILIVFTFLTLCSYGQQQTQNKQVINIDSLFKAKQIEALGKPLSFFTTSYNNKPFTNENLKGKTVFINFWFAACAPCIAELDELNKLYDTLKSNEKFEFISFTPETPKVIKKIIKKYKIHYKVFSLNGVDCKRLNRNSAFPTSLIIDPNGTIKLFKIGGSINKAEVKKTIFTDYYPKILNEL